MLTETKGIDMNGWQITELSKKAKVSVRTLHYYDAIKLLQPSMRLPNGYRLYSQDDLARLQQIVALKFFNFSLKQIKHLLSKKGDWLAMVRAQQALLEQKIVSLQEASAQIDQIIQLWNKQGSIDIQNSLKLIEVYGMTKQLEKTWAGKILNKKELTQLAELIESMPDSEAEQYGKRWHQLVQTVRNHLQEDPRSEVAKKLACEWMSLVNEWYDDKPELKERLWHAFKGGEIPQNEQDELHFPNIDKAMTDWIESVVKFHKL